MHPASIIDAIASQADDLLAEASGRAEALAVLQEHLASAYPGLGAAERKQVLKGVLAILEREDFFGGPRGGGDRFDGGGGGEEPEE